MKIKEFKIGDRVRVEAIYDPLHELSYGIGDVGTIDGIIVSISPNDWRYLVKLDACESDEWISGAWLERENPIFKCE